MARHTGSTHDNVRHNLYRLRTQRRTSLRELSATMAGKGGALSYSSIGEIERGVRRCDVDELTALAAALEVSPMTLLMPHADSPDEGVSLTGISCPIRAGDAIKWLRGDSPHSHESDDEHVVEAFRRRALPWWAWAPAGS